MTTTEQGTRRTITQLHEEVAGFDATIKKQEGIVGTHGRNIIKEFSPADDTPPEDLISGIYNVGIRRLTLIERINQNSIPYLEGKKNEVLQEEDAAVSEAKEAYEGIHTLSRLGVYSLEEQRILEEGIANLPDEIAKRIRTAPLKIHKPETSEPQHVEEKPSLLRRLLGRSRKTEVPVALQTTVNIERHDEKPAIEKAVEKPIPTPVVRRVFIEEGVPPAVTDSLPIAIEPDKAEDNVEDKRKFPDGKFLGKDTKLPFKIYQALIEYSTFGKLPASEDLENKIFGEEIKSGAITQSQAHLKIRDGLNMLRRKLTNTGISILNKGTGKFPFYGLEITGEIPEHVWNPLQERKITVNTSTENAQTQPGAKPEEIALPLPDVIGRSGSIKQKYYEFLLAKKAEGITTSIEEEADYIYGQHSNIMMARIYTMRQQINFSLAPYGIRVGSEKRTAKGTKEMASAKTTAEPALAQKPGSASEEPELRNETAQREAPTAADQPRTETQSEQTGKITLRSGERRALQILEGTSEDNTITTEEIAAKFFPDKKIRRDDTITVQTFIAGLKSFSLPGTGIDILHPLTKDGNPILNMHYLKLPEGKRLEDLVDFELSPTLQQTASTERAERIVVPVASIDLQEGTAVEFPVSGVPEPQEITLPHFVIYEAEMEVKFAGQKSRFRFADQWEVFKRIAQRPNQELTPQELAGLDPEKKDIKALKQAENYFRNFVTRFEESPNNPQVFIISGGNRYPRFTFRATVEFVPDQKPPSKRPYSPKTINQLK